MMELHAPSQLDEVKLNRRTNKKRERVEWQTSSLSYATTSVLCRVRSGGAVERASNQRRLVLASISLRNAQRGSHACRARSRGATRRRRLLTSLSQRGNVPLAALYRTTG